MISFGGEAKTTYSLRNLSNIFASLRFSVDAPTNNYIPRLKSAEKGLFWGHL